MTGAVPGLFDAVAQLYDGHGGKMAARHCVAQLVPRVAEAFFDQKACRAFRNDTESLVRKTRDGFHPSFDAAVIEAFEQLDEEIKRVDPSGTTATALFFKKSEDGDVHVKCAWVGDSRAVLTRDFDPARTMDLSDDHKPGSASEVIRIRNHYEALHGGLVFKSRHEVLEQFEASVRGGLANRGEKPPPPGSREAGNRGGLSTGSPGGSSRGSSRPQSRGNSQRGGNRGSGTGPNSRGGSRNGPDLTARDGLPAVEMTLGHAVAIEEAVWDCLGSPDETFGTAEAAVATKAQRESRERGRAVTEAHKAPISLEDLSVLREIASRSPDAGEGEDSGGASGFAARGNSANGASSVPAEIVGRTSVAFMSVDARRSMDEAIKTNQLPPSREPSDGDGLCVDWGKKESAPAARRGETTGASTPPRTDADDADEDELGSSDGDSEPAFRRAAAARMSFVGYYKNDQGIALSKPRIYSSSGESHGVSRSIGDRGSARACVSTPEINTVIVPSGSGARFMVCSDGVWDVFSSEKSARRVSRFVSPQGAAKRMCVAARERAEYRGMSADDITAVVVDVGVNEKGDEPRCACVVS